MSSVRLGFAAALLPVLLFASPVAALRAQEAPRPETPHESEADQNKNQTPEDRKEDEDRKRGNAEGWVVRTGRSGHLTTGEGYDAPRLPPKPIEVYWKINPSGNPRYLAFEDGKQTPLTRAQILALYKDGQKVLNTGVATQYADWHNFTADFADRTIIHEEGSPNQTDAELDRAMTAAAGPLRPAETVVFTALPQQSSAQFFAAEKRRMQIGGTGPAWKDLNGEIEKSSGDFPARVATRKALLNEIANGTSNVILVYAHFDGTTLHMPDANGRQGEGITLDDFKNLADRANAGDRVIVLVACNTARAVPGESSLVSLLLKKHLARAVLATAFPYDARKLPAFLQNLAKGIPPGKADPQLRQYVELDWWKIGDELRFSRGPAIEVAFHG
jgi:hypothetical protein